MKLAGSHVVVLGGSSGMGFAIAKAARAAGADVTIASRSRDRLEQAADSIPGCRAVRCDMQDEEEVRQLLATPERVDHVVVTAAEVVLTPVAQAAPRDTQRVIGSRIWGSLFVAKHAGPRMPVGGSITFMSGIAAWRGLPGEAVGAASLGAVEALARALAVELAPVRVNALCPGLIDTPLLHHLLGDQHGAVIAQVSDRLPVKRIGRPEEIAQAALFLMTNGYVTGTTLRIDGGHVLV